MSSRDSLLHLGKEKGWYVHKPARRYWDAIEHRTRHPFGFSAFIRLSVCLQERMLGCMVIWLQSFSHMCPKYYPFVRLFVCLSVFMTGCSVVFIHVASKEWLHAVIESCVFVFVLAVKKYVCSE